MQTLLLSQAFCGKGAQKILDLKLCKNVSKKNLVERISELPIKNVFQRTKGLVHGSRSPSEFGGSAADTDSLRLVIPAHVERWNS